jgi:hypothetical protein
MGDIERLSLVDNANNMALNKSRKRGREAGTVMVLIAL